MGPVRDIRIELVKLGNGERLLRLTEPASGLSMEKTLDPRQPLLRQKARLLDVFNAALDRASVAAA
jgi:hypothetical protein